MNVPDKRLAIVTTTLRLINKQGFHATPMSQIAREARVAAGTIYHYFYSKEDLITAVYEYVRDRMAEALVLQLSYANGYQAKFWVFWLNQYRFLSQNPDDFWFLEQYAVSPFMKHELVEVTRQHYQPFIDFLEEGVMLGILRQMDPVLMAYMLNAQISMIVKLELTGVYQPSMQSLQALVLSNWDMVKEVKQG